VDLQNILKIILNFQGWVLNQKMVFCVRFTLKIAKFCQETRKSFIFREKIPFKIWLVGDECVPLHPLLGLAPRRASRKSVLWKIYIEDK